MSRSWILTMLLVLAAAVIGGGIVVFMFETRHGAGTQTITNIGDALWWSFSAAAAVGYGDFYPITIGGRVFAIMVTVAGLVCVGAISGLVVSMLLTERISRVRTELKQDISEIREWKVAKQTKVDRGVQLSTLAPRLSNERFHRSGGIETLVVRLSARASEMVSRSGGIDHFLPWYVEFRIANSGRELAFFAENRSGVNRYYAEIGSEPVVPGEYSLRYLRTLGQLSDEIKFDFPENHLATDYQLLVDEDRHGNDIHYIDLQNPSARHLVGCTCGVSDCPARPLPEDAIILRGR